MHAGLPVLASNTGGPLETIVEGETGWLRDAHAVDEWTKVMDHVLNKLIDKDVARMAAAGKARAEREFSLTAMGDRLEEEISRMLTANRRPFYGWQQVFFILALVGAFITAVATFLLRVL